jgi:hypothetical protein
MSWNKNHVLVIGGLLLVLGAFVFHASPPVHAFDANPSTTGVACVASNLAYGASTTCTAGPEHQYFESRVTQFKKTLRHSAGFAELFRLPQ